MQQIERKSKRRLTLRYRRQRGDGKERVVGEATNGNTLRDSSTDNDSAKHFQNRHQLTESKKHICFEASEPLGG